MHAANTLCTLLSAEPALSLPCDCSPVQEFSEWAQCQVLEFAAHYRPSGEQEVYDFMNVLDDRLSHSNSAVVMATVKLFLHYTLSMPATHQQVHCLCLCMCFKPMHDGVAHMCIVAVHV